MDWRQTTINRGIGSNLRLSDLAASLGIAGTDHLGERLARKRTVFDLLSSALGEHLFQAGDGGPSMQHIVFVAEPDDLVRHMAKEKIAAARQYRPMYHHPPFTSLRDREYPASEFWFEHAVYLPFGVALSEADAERIASAVRRVGTAGLWLGANDCRARSDESIERARVASATAVVRGGRVRQDRRRRRIVVGVGAARSPLLASLSGRGWIRDISMLESNA